MSRFTTKLRILLRFDLCFIFKFRLISFLAKDLLLLLVFEILFLGLFVVAHLKLQDSELLSQFLFNLTQSHR